MGQRSPARRVDLAIAGGLLALGQLEIGLRGAIGSAAAAHVLWAAAAVAVLWRRGRPVLFFAWALLVHALVVGFDLSPQFGALYALYPQLALFGLGAYVRDPRHAVAAAAGGLLATMLLRAGLDLAGLLGDRGGGDWLREAGIYAPAAAGGVLLRDRTEALLGARRRAASAVAGDDGAVDLAITVERTRIARELHAVVRGCVRAVLDDVAAARATRSLRPAAARTALRRARDASQQAMGEMRRMLALLRTDAPGEGAVPAPDIAGGGVGGVGTGRPDAADVPTSLVDLAARVPGGSPIAVRRAHSGAPFPDAPLPAVAMRVLVALAELPGCARIAIERGDGMVRATARLTGEADRARVEALSERARLAGGRLRQGRLRRGRIALTLPAAVSGARLPPERNPWLRLPPFVRAQGIPLLLLVLEVAEALLAPADDAADVGTATLPVRLAGAVLLAAAFLPRRRFPLATVVLVVAIAALRTEVLNDWFGLNPPLYLAAFVAGAYMRPLWAAVAAGVFVVVGGLGTIVVTFGWEYAPASVFVFVATMSGAIWTTGLGGRRRLAEAEELRTLAAEEERRQGRAIARAVNAERLRVARELHDLVGHGLTSITLQCAVADQLLDRRPADADVAIAAIEEVGQDVLRELHQLLAALDGGDERELPALAGLPELARRAESQGLEVRLELVGDVAAVPAGHAGAAYRIVQESLTNARKHGGERSGSGRVAVQARVALERGRLAIEVRNPLAAAAAHGAGAPAPGSGLGLPGMRERVRVYDGWLAAGAERGGDWVVRAELPIAR
jgi:signal transduction histidine kinase